MPVWLRIILGLVCLIGGILLLLTALSIFFGASIVSVKGDTGGATTLLNFFLQVGGLALLLLIVGVLLLAWAWKDM
jgi:hypothetical protein